MSEQLQDVDAELIQSLYSYAHYEEQNHCPKTASNLRAAADRLTALTSRVKELEELLKPLARMANYYEVELAKYVTPQDCLLNDHDPESATAADALAARAALSPSPASKQ